MYVVGMYSIFFSQLNSDTKEDCRALLTSIDRLQVVFASYNYVLDMWNKASCECM